MLCRARTRAKRDGLEFNLTRRDIVIPQKCPALGIELEWRDDGKSGPLPNSPSLDKVRPELGYVRGNVVVVSNKANRMKQDATPEELMRVAEFYWRLCNADSPREPR